LGLSKEPHLSLGLQYETLVCSPSPPGSHDVVVTGAPLRVRPSVRPQAIVRRPELTPSLAGCRCSTVPSPHLPPAPSWLLASNVGKSRAVAPGSSAAPPPSAVCREAGPILSTCL
jgi:hypothetical protein